MHHIPIVSTVIAGVGFDPKAQALEIVLRDGELRRYEDVPEAVWSRLLIAESRVRVMREEIEGRYPVSVFHHEG